MTVSGGDATLYSTLTLAGHGEKDDTARFLDIRRNKALYERNIIAAPTITADTGNQAYMGSALRSTPR